MKTLKTLLINFKEIQMIDSRNKFSPRYIHMPYTYIGRGITIAYVRDNSHVFFAWSIVSPDDSYNKSIGRSISTDRLNDSLPEMLMQADINGSLIFVANSCGFISSAELISRDTDISAIISDQMLANLTPMDFKHSYITNVVSTAVMSALTA